MSEGNCTANTLLGVEDEAGEVNCDILSISRHERLPDFESSDQVRPTPVALVLVRETSEPNEVLCDPERSALSTSAVFLKKIVSCTGQNEEYKGFTSVTRVVPLAVS